MSDADPILEELRRLPLRSRSGRRKSSVRLFLETHATDFANRNWTDVAELLNSHGMKDSHGKRLTARSLRSIWQRVKATHQAQQASNLPGQQRGAIGNAGGAFFRNLRKPSP